MKIVQSFWSKPTVYTEDNSEKGFFQRGKSGGWLEKKNYYISWALSCLQLKKFYDNVELVTDRIGKEILIDQLQLPYSNVVLELDCLNDYHADLWALGKVHSYGLQKEPFIHVDSDIFIWGKFGIENSELISQNFEKGNFYNEILNQFNGHFKYFPECLRGQIENTETVHSINAGIFGGTNWKFINKYAREARYFVDQNIDSLGKIEIGKFNVLFEQILFYYMANQKNIEISKLIDDTFSHYGQWIVDFDGVPHKTKFIHAIGSHKRDPVVNARVVSLLESNYPEYYKRINEVFN